MRWLDDIANSMYLNLGKLQEIIRDREALYASVHGISKSWAWLSNNNKSIKLLKENIDNKNPKETNDIGYIKIEEFNNNDFTIGDTILINHMLMNDISNTVNKSINNVLLEYLNK